MSDDQSVMGASKQADANMIGRQRNDAARILLRYLGHVAMFQSDKEFGIKTANANSDDTRIQSEMRDLTRKCRAAAFKLGLIGFVRDKIVLTEKGKRFVPGFLAKSEGTSVDRTPVPTPQPTQNP